MAILLSLLLLLLSSSSSSSFSYSSFSPSSSSASSITLVLTPRSTSSSTTKIWQRLNYQAIASLERTQQHGGGGGNTTNITLYPRSYGAYSVSLPFGTPTQTLPFIMDTGSSLSWFPCTQNYTCIHCDFPGPPHPATFIPESSSSSTTVPCGSPQCEWLLHNDQCNKTPKYCPYRVQYGLGYTTGRLISESLSLGALSADNFAVGCSSSSAYVPEGVVGFGHHRESLPAQLDLTRFSYCLVSHDFDDNGTATSNLVLTTTTGTSTAKCPFIQYTPFIKNPNVRFSGFYYVGMESLSVGGVNLNVSSKYLVPDAEGGGGTIVDSGSTFTMMVKPVFDRVFEEFERQVGKMYTRDGVIEKQTSLEPCYKVVVGNNDEKVLIPGLTLHFAGGAEMNLSLSNYFTYADEQRSVMCMTIKSSGEEVSGPAIVLGNYLQQDYYVEYDLEFNQLGIRQQKCGG